MARPTILLDCDEVLCDFVTPILAAANAKSRAIEPRWRDVTRVDLGEWELSTFFPLLHPRDVYSPALLQGFARALRPLEGAVRAVRALQDIGEVYCVTAPMVGATHWCGERLEWLQLLCGIPADRVIITSAKAQIDGEIMVDDRPKHLEEWVDRHRWGIGLLWDAPWNRHFECGGMVGRISSWAEVIEAAEACL